MAYISFGTCGTIVPDASSASGVLKCSLPSVDLTGFPCGPSESAIVLDMARSGSRGFATDTVTVEPFPGLLRILSNFMDLECASSPK